MIEVYRYDPEADSLVIQATVNNDASVDGDSVLADRFRNVIDSFSFDPEENIDAIEVTIEYKYNNALYATDRS